MARAVDFEGRTNIYGHPDCYNLPVAIQDTVLDGQQTVEIISAWQITTDEMEVIKANGGIIFLRVIGGAQPPVEVTGFNPINS